MMMPIAPLNNSNTLLFTSKNKALDEMSTMENTPSAVLLTLWEQWDLSDFQKIKPLVKRLIGLGCKYFVCAGKYSESLHDFVDDVILDMSPNGHGENENNIVTTWHDEDTDDEVADFFLHSTNMSGGLLLGIFSDDRPEDERLKTAVVTLANKEKDHDIPKN